MRSSYFKSGYFLVIGILTLTIFFLFFKKEEKKKQFNLLPILAYTEIDGYKNTTKNLPESELFAVFLFNPGCEMCQAEVEDISDNMEELANCCFLFLSPDSLSRIETFIKDYQLYDKENVFYGQVNLDSVDIKFGKSAVPWSFVYDKNRELVKSGLFVYVSELVKYLPK